MCWLLNLLAGDLRRPNGGRDGRMCWLLNLLAADLGRPNGGRDGEDVLASEPVGERSRAT